MVGRFFFTEGEIEVFLNEWKISKLKNNNNEGHVFGWIGFERQGSRTRAAPNLLILRGFCLVQESSNTINNEQVGVMREERKQWARD